MIVARHDGSGFLLYGEHYGNVTGADNGGTFPWPGAPTLAIYSSPDLVAWTYEGPGLPNGTDAGGTVWIPNVFWEPKSAQYIMWFGSGDWGIATSPDGIHWTLLKAHTGSRLPGGTDGTGCFIDDDGTGYVIFSWPDQGHLVSIERMAPDYLGSSGVNVSGFFLDDYVESPSLFKRNGVYYVTYGSCCCACRGGGGQVVFTSSSIHGPWVRQAPWADINCANASATICGAFGARTTQRNNLVFNAQWWGPSFIPTVGGSTTVLFTGRRWISGPNNPPGCDDYCGNGGRKDLCVAGDYRIATDYDVWYPLEFAADGAILPFHPLPSFTLDLPTTAR